MEQVPRGFGRGCALDHKQRVSLAEMLNKDAGTGDRETNRREESAGGHV